VPRGSLIDRTRAVRIVLRYMRSDVHLAKLSYEFLPLCNNSIQPFSTNVVKLHRQLAAVSIRQRQIKILATINFRVAEVVYSIDEFPDDDLLWRIEWVAGVGYNANVPSDLWYAIIPSSRFQPMLLISTTCHGIHSPENIKSVTKSQVSAMAAN
jgi:hypothetical protein